MPPSCLTLARFATSLRPHRLSKNAAFGSRIALPRSPDPPPSPSWTNRSGRLCGNGMIIRCWPVRNKGESLEAFRPVPWSQQR